MVGTAAAPPAQRVDHGYHVRRVDLSITRTGERGASGRRKKGGAGGVVVIWRPRLGPPDAPS